FTDQQPSGEGRIGARVRRPGRVPARDALGFHDTTAGSGVAARRLDSAPSTDQWPGPSAAIIRNDQQNRAAVSPPLLIGSSPSGWWTTKYAYAIEPEQMIAAMRVRRPARTSRPPANWITAAYHPGQVPTAIASPEPRLPP